MCYRPFKVHQSLSDEDFMHYLQYFPRTYDFGFIVGRFMRVALKNLRLCSDSNCTSTDFHS